jgi:hypothetical protein
MYLYLGITILVVCAMSAIVFGGKFLGEDFLKLLCGIACGILFLQLIVLGFTLIYHHFYGG